MTLVFGCRGSDTDHLFKEETLDMRDNGTLSSVTTAYSRQAGQPKVDKLVTTVVISIYLKKKKNKKN